MAPWFRTALATLLLLTLFCARPSAAADPLILAIHPYLPAAELHKRFTPLASYLSQALGQPVAVRVGVNYDEHIAAVGRDEVDIAFMGPVPYVKMISRYGPKPLLARFEVNGDPNLYGTIVTRSQSPLRSIKELKGHSFAFGDPESTMSHIMPRHLLMEAGVTVNTLSEFRFLGSHHNVALAVLAGDFDAGAVKREVFDEFEGKGLRLLALTPPTPDHLFLARSTLPLQQIQRLREALLGLKDRPGGKAIMTGLHKQLTGLIPASESDYQQLRAIVLDVERDE